MTGSDRSAPRPDQGDPLALYETGMRLFRKGDQSGARSAFEKSRAVAETTSDEAAVARALTGLARVHLRDGALAEARELSEEAATVFRRLGDKQGLSNPQHVIAYVTMMQGQLERARDLFEESLAHYRELGDEHGVTMELQNLGVVEKGLGDLIASESSFREGLTRAVQLHDQSVLPYFFLGLAAVAAERSDVTRAVRLLGATDECLETSGEVLDPGDQPLYDETLERLRHLLGEDQLELERAPDKHLSVDKAIELALG